MKISISDECIGCGKCVKKCKHNVLRLENGKIFVNDLSLCKGSKKCEGVCPKQAISIGLTADEEKHRNRKLKIKKTVIVFVLLMVLLTILWRIFLEQ